MANPYEYRGRGEGFLDDNSGLAAAGSFFENALKGYQQGQEHEQKMLEQKAQIEAMKTRSEREKFQSQLEAAKEGYKQGPDGSLQQIALTPKQQGLNSLKAIGEGVKATGFDEFGNPTGYEADPSSPKMVQARAQQALAGQRIAATTDRVQTMNNYRNDAIDRREHEKVLTRIASNPIAKQKLNQIQGMDNALKIITDSDHITPEQIHEFQQAIRANIGIKGTSGIGEREETYFKSIGLNAARMKEFLTSEPASIAKDSKLLDHFRQLAAIEQKNVRSQYEKALNAASAGHSSMYARRADLKADLDDAIAAQQEQVGSSDPQGLVPQGMVKQGLVQGGSQQKPKTVIQNGHTYTLNPQSGEYE